MKTLKGKFLATEIDFWAMFVQSISFGQNYTTETTLLLWSCPANAQRKNIKNYTANTCGERQQFKHLRGTFIKSNIHVCLEL